MSELEEGMGMSSKLEERGQVHRPDGLVVEGHPGVARDLEELDEIDPEGSMSARLRRLVEEKLKNV